MSALCSAWLAIRASSCCLAIARCRSKMCSAAVMLRDSDSTSWVSNTLLPGALTSDARLPRVE
ncbi:hypothetical protein D9M71_380800 [compost metagenome]